MGPPMGLQSPWTIAARPRPPWGSRGNPWAPGGPPGVPGGPQGPPRAQPPPNPTPPRWRIDHHHHHHHHHHRQHATPQGGKRTPLGGGRRGPVHPGCVFLHYSCTQRPVVPLLAGRPVFFSCALLAGHRVFFSCALLPRMRAAGTNVAPSVASHKWSRPDPPEGTGGSRPPRPYRGASPRPNPGSTSKSGVHGRIRGPPASAAALGPPRARRRGLGPGGAPPPYAHDTSRHRTS